MSRPRIAFVTPVESAFVQEDVRILGEVYDLETFVFKSGRGTPRKQWTLLSERVRLSRWLTATMPQVAAAFAWFADYHSAPLAISARRHHVPMALVIGGYDAMKVPEQSHGVYASSWRAPLARQASRASTVLLPVAEALVRTQNPFLPTKSQEQGLDVFAPDHAPTLTVPTGYEPDVWPMGAHSRTPRVLTVGIIDSAKRAWIKGIDLVIEAARKFPEVPFEIIGVPGGNLVPFGLDVPPNVSVHPPVPRDELVAAYQRASVYLQLSRVEGMPNVLCEAMLCGAVPVGTNVFGIPAAIGRAGWTVSRPDVTEISERIQTALSAPPSLRQDARDHIASAFPLSRRRRVLRGVLNGLTDGHAPADLITGLA